MRKASLKATTFVGCVSGPEYGAESHCYYSVTITPGDLAKIKKLAAAVKRLDVYCIELFDYAVQSWPRVPYYTDAVLRGVVLHGDPPSDHVDDGVDPIETLPEANACELQMLRVCDAQFAWTWIPKRGSRLEECETQTFYIDDVEQTMTQRAAKSGGK